MAASPSLPGTFAPRSPQRRRPAIMRWKTRKRSPSNSSAMRLPMRWMRTTCLPKIAEMGGSKVRNTKGEARRTAWTGCRNTRGSSASMYAVMSGSSGTQLDQLEHVPVRVFEVARPAAGNLLGRSERAGAVPLDQGAHLLERLYADAQDWTAAIVAAALEGGAVEDGMQREADARAQLHLDPARGRRSFGEADRVVPEAARLFE